MASQKPEEKLLSATIALLQETSDMSKITARDIVLKADVNLAMINYCYGSKDKLIAVAVDQIIEEDFNKLFEVCLHERTAKEQIRILLQGICEAVFHYEDMLRLSMPYLLLENKIEVPEKILPLVTKCLEGKKTERECKIIAYQVVSFMQLIFYQQENFKAYSGIDLRVKAEREAVINMQVDLFFD